MKYLVALMTLGGMVLSIPVSFCIAVLIAFPGITYGFWRGLISEYVKLTYKPDSTNVVQFRNK